jgi:HNH endonuclease
MDDCIEWSHRKSGGGYGMLRIDGRSVYAHRGAWTRANGPIPAGMCVLHVCDNPPCVNPEHLWVGTMADNMRDRSAKLRGKGQANAPGIFVGLFHKYDRVRQEA